MVAKITLGSLLREYGGYSGHGSKLTSSFDSVVADVEDIQDAHIMAGEGGDWFRYLITILSDKERIPTSPYDEEQVDC